MPNPGLSDADKAASVKAFERHGRNLEAAAAELGLKPNTLKSRLRSIRLDPAIQAAADAAGIVDTSIIADFWQIIRNEDGSGYSIRIKNPDNGEELSLSEMVKASIEEALGDKAPAYPARPKPAGDHLLLIDLADVHFLKLSVKTETGFQYDRQIARHRVIEGTKALLEEAGKSRIGRILFVLGNDVLNVDNGKSKTTNGTEQDCDGTIFQGFSDAFAAYRDAIELCAEVAPVDLVHNMSNHDRLMGWALSQKLGAWFANHPNVHSTEYNLSPMNRKYYGYGNNAFQIHHADGAKEEKLYGLFVAEARELIGKCKNLYSICHHLHHKIRKRRGIDVFTTEKDHTGLTAISFGSPAPEGSDLQIEYVRSPSAPESWHSMFGFVNRQAVECFLYHPQDGQKHRFTEWF